MPVDVEGLDPDPLVELAAWVAQAEAAGHRLPQAFALATADDAGRPSVRLVLLRGIEPDGLRFYTNRDSAKGQELEVNPRAAAAFWWEQTNRQVRVSGRVVPVDEAEVKRYWASRPRGHQLAAWASKQSQPIGDRADLEAQVEAMTVRFGPETAIPLPPFWGGYRLEPEQVEFWESQPDRLHDRIEYRRDPQRGWVRRRLQP
ncbi:MAG TPA: pyridoxamine 5'-phosphate oxidase [Pleomorphomonadaceae bacterium]|nr:pyridoxamine 5'-phosphate oxidase [Pleomorphomonadaceae bacterium]